MVIHVGLSPQFVFRTIAAEAVLCDKAWTEPERNSSYVTHCRISNRFISRRALATGLDRCIAVAMRRARVDYHKLLQLAYWECAALIARVIEIPTLAAIPIMPLRTGATIIVA